MNIQTYIIGILVAWIIAFGERLIAKYVPVADAQKIAAQKQIAAQEIANKKGAYYDAVRFVKDLYVKEDGATLLKAAIDVAAKKITAMGLPATPEEIEEGCRVAYQDFAAQITPTVTPVPTK